MLEPGGITSADSIQSLLLLMHDQSCEISVLSGFQYIELQMIILYLESLNRPTNCTDENIS